MRVIKLLFIILGFYYLFSPEITSSAMSSGNYQIFEDSFNFTASTKLNSNNYLMVSSAGEISMGKSSSSAYVLDSGSASIYREPSISMAVDQDSIDLGILSSTTTAYASHGLDVFSNSRTGYVLHVYAEPFQNPNGDIIDFIGPTASPSNIGTKQFGINLVANTNPPVGADPVLRSAVIDSDYATANQFAFANADTLAVSNTFSKDHFTISYIVNISPTTIAGQYSTKITYSLASNF